MKSFSMMYKCLYVKKSGSEVTEEQILTWEARCSHWPIQFFVIPHDDVKETIQDFLQNHHIDLRLSSNLKEIISDENVHQESKILVKGVFDLTN